MNKLLITLWILASINCSYGQEKIEGIGPFKIGRYTIKELERYADQNNRRIKLSDNYMDEVSVGFGNSDKKIYELVVNKKDLTQSSSKSKLVEGVRVFKIPAIKVSGIEVKKLILSFFKDTLYSLECDYSFDIAQAIETKYGKGVDEVKTKDVSCVYNLTGNQVTLKEEMFFSKWENENIDACVAVGHFYDSNCKEQSKSFVYIQDTQKVEYVNTADEIAKEKLTEAQNIEKKKALSNF
jgi:hypothetical protein